jgi:inorganic pyrophosphatase
MKFKEILEYITDENPTDAQISAGNYKKKHLKLHGLDISIETEQGMSRSGIDETCKKWTQRLTCDYGYVRGTVGKDKDHVDVFVGPCKSSEKVYIIHQLKKDGSFDEHKTVMAVPDLHSAEKLYTSNYCDGWNRYEPNIVEMSTEEFKDWVRDEKSTKKKIEKIYDD